MMEVPFFTLERQHEILRRELDQAFQKVVDGGRFILGQEVSRFESHFSKYLNVSHCISCANGTDAIELTLEGLGIKQGDEVILPDNTWMSVAEAVVRTGGKPIFCPVSQGSFTIDSKQISKRLSDQTFAVIVVHQYGCPVEIAAIKKALVGYDVFVVEDCAHAVGAKVGNNHCGTLTDAATFSFYPTKNLGALGDGGAMTTNNRRLAERIRLLRNHGQIERDRHLLAGRNSRLDELQAAFLNVKLPLLDQWNERRREIAAMYYSGLNGTAELGLPADENRGHVFHQFVIETQKRDALKKYLEVEGVKTSIHYPANISDMSIFNEVPLESNNLTKASERILSLPIFPELRDEEINYVIEKVRCFFE